MDDLYQNAWGDSTTLAAGWTSSHLHDDEADLAAPSWSTGSAVPWDDPTGSPGFSWSHAEPDQAWQSSAYEGIVLSKHSEEDVQETSSQRETEEADQPDASTQGADAFHAEISSPPRLPSPTPAFVPTNAPAPVHAETVFSPPDLDGFGTFETGDDADTPSGVPFGAGQVGDDSDAWGSAWASTEPQRTDEVSEKPVDEWVRAREEKAQLDRKLVSELRSQLNVYGGWARLCSLLYHVNTIGT